MNVYRGCYTYMCTYAGARGEFFISSCPCGLSFLLQAPRPLVEALELEGLAHFWTEISDVVPGIC